MLGYMAQNNTGSTVVQHKLQVAKKKTVQLPASWQRK